MSGIIVPNDWDRIDSITGWMTEPECQWLALMASTVCSWTEIGVNNGRSAMGVGLGLRYGGRLQLIDVEFAPDFWSNCRWLRSRRPDLRIIMAEAASPAAAAWLADTDVVFIDGDHSFDAVVADIRAWRGKCRTLCGHDYQHGKFPLGHEDVVLAVDQEVGTVDIPVGTIWWARQNP